MPLDIITDSMDENLLNTPSRGISLPPLTEPMLLDRTVSNNNDTSPTKPTNNNNQASTNTCGNQMTTNQTLKKGTGSRLET